MFALKSVGLSVDIYGLIITFKSLLLGANLNLV